METFIACVALRCGCGCDDSNVSHFRLRAKTHVDAEERLQLVTQQPGAAKRLWDAPAPYIETAFVLELDVMPELPKPRAKRKAKKASGK